MGHRDRLRGLGGRGYGQSKLAQVLRFLAGVYQPGWPVEIGTVNGATGLLVGSPLDAVVTWEVAGTEVVSLYVQRYPEKLRGLAPLDCVP